MNNDKIIQQTVAAIRPLDGAAMAQAAARQARLTKPTGALGRLESLSIQLAGICGTLTPTFDHKQIIVCAADHGVTVEGVSAYPRTVTGQMVQNFLAGGAAINVIARQMGAGVTVIDFGVDAPLPPHPDLISARLGPGTQNLAAGPAMCHEQAGAAIAAGIQAVKEMSAAGHLDLLVLGEMGIGNTTAAAAIGAALTGQPITAITGRGTGVNDAQYQHKIEVIHRALAVNKPNPLDALDVLAKVGGFEIGGMVGLCLAGAARQIPIVVDGFIATSAALLAVTLAPQVKSYLIAAHRSHEQGHRLLLEYLGIVPLLELDLRLGEGTGGALVIPLIETAMRLLNEMATFDSARVDERE